jgi:hypothetical protein
MLPKLHHRAGVLSRIFAGGAEGKKPTTLINKYDVVRNHLTCFSWMAPAIKASKSRFVEDMRQLANRIAFPLKVEDEYSDTVEGLAGPFKFIIACTSR